MLPPPALILTHLLNAYCNVSNCDWESYPKPLPENYKRNGKSLFNEQTLLPPIVNTLSGTVEGYYMTVLNGRQIYAFEGIPYAEKPIGNNRFKAPQPKVPWFEKLETKNPGPICLQFVQRKVRGDEDCLRLNVYTPRIPSGNDPSPGLPILIFIHGGFFFFGSGQFNGPAYLLQEDVILVTLNYRLGILGSMTTGDEVASGNWGLKDQAMAINWVYDNIKYFGGNPRKITLSGQSAGAASVHMQMMSSWANDKIASAISFSAGAYNFWALNSLKKGKNLGAAYARAVNCPTNLGSQEMINCMRKVKASALAASLLLTLDFGLPVPCIEPKVDGAFLTVTPDEAYALGHVAKIPYVTTITSEETNSVISTLYSRRLLPLVAYFFEVHASILLGYRGQIPFENESSVFQKIKTFYGQDGRSFNFSRHFLTEASNARYFRVPFHKTVQMHSQIAPTYAGIFNYVSNINGPARRGLDPQEFGVTHSDDIILMLNSSFSPPTSVNDERYIYTKLFTNIYKNFADKGKPTFTMDNGVEHKFWEKTDNTTNLKILRIGNEIKHIKDPYLQISTFWESLGFPDMTPYFRVLF